MRKKQRLEKRNEGIAQIFSKIIDLVLKPMLIGFSSYCVLSVLLFGDMNLLFVGLVISFYLLLTVAKNSFKNYAWQQRSGRYKVLITK